MNLHRSINPVLKWGLLFAGLAFICMAAWFVDHSATVSVKKSLQENLNTELKTSDAVNIQTLRTWVMNTHGENTAKGNWCTSGKAIEPCADLRSKFDFYLIAANRTGTTYSDIRELVQADANLEAAGASGKIIALFDRYWILHNYAWKQPWHEHDPTTWPAAKAERDQVRQEILGTDWAHAFYAQERQPYLAVIDQQTPQGVASIQAQITAALSAEEMVTKHWPDISEEEKAKRVKELSHLIPTISGIQDKSERKLLIAQAQWKRIQQEDALSTAEQKAAMKEIIHDSFEPHEYETVAHILKLY